MLDLIPILVEKHFVTIHQISHLILKECDNAALRCIDTVVKTMLARRAKRELTLSTLAHANELVLSPCNVQWKLRNLGLHANNKPNMTVTNSIVFCHFD